MCSRATSLFAIVVLGATLSACSAAIRPPSVDDALTAVRVKTALVNDPDVGVHPIHVRVSNHVASLSGYVPDEEAESRAVAVARAVPGISDVRSELAIGGRPPPIEAPDAEARAAGRPDPERGGAGDRRRLAIGGSVGWNGLHAGTLDPSQSIGPLVRIGGGQGLGLAIGFGWFGSDLVSVSQADAVIGRVKIKPVMGGLGYTVRNERLSMSLSGVAGVAFNSVTRAEALTGREVPLDLTNSLVWRPGVSFWLDASDRIALNLSIGYVMTRPRLSLLDEGQIVRRRLNADTLLLRVGVAYKIF